MRIKTNEDNHRCGMPQPPSPEERRADGGRSAFLRNLLETREFRRIFGRLLPELVSAWAGGSRMKGQIAKIVNRVLTSGFFQPGRGPYESLRDRGFLADETGKLVDLVTQHADELIRAWSTAFQEMSPAEKKVFLEQMMGHLFNGRTGSLVTHVAAALNQIHETDPEFIARTLEPGIQNWIKTTDFGELKEWAGKSTRDLAALVRLFNDEMWHYPAKVVLLLSLLPEAANLAVAGATDTLGRFNLVSPDLVTDIILTLVGEIDGASVGRGINELAELVRKVGTGSALIGEPGSPRLPEDVARLYDQVATTLDYEKFLKARRILSEQKAAVNERLLERLKTRPDVLLEMAAQFPALKNSRLSSVWHLLSALEAMPEAEVTGALEKGLAAVDTDMVADMITVALTLFHRTCEYRPALISDFVSRIMNEIDPDLLSETSHHLLAEVFPDLMLPLQPLLPAMIHGLCDALEPRSGEYEDELARARDRLGRLLLKGAE